MPRLYGHPHSPYTQRVLLTLEELDIPFHFIPVSLETKENLTRDFFSINPFGKVPTLDWDGFKLAESLAIMRFLSSSNRSLSLYPSDLKERAVMDQWMDYCNIHIGIPFTQLTWIEYWSKTYGVKKTSERVEPLKTKILKQLPPLEQALEASDYICGSSLSLADLSLLPQVILYDKSKIDLNSFPKILAWIKKMAERNSTKTLKLV